MNERLVHLQRAINRLLDQPEDSDERFHAGDLWDGMPRPSELADALLDTDQIGNEILTVLIQTSRQNLEPGELAARITTRLKDKGII